MTTARSMDKADGKTDEVRGKYILCWFTLSSLNFPGPRLSVNGRRAESGRSGVVVNNISGSVSSHRPLQELININRM